MSAQTGTEIRNGRSTLKFLQEEIDKKSVELSDIAPRVDAAKQEEREVAGRVNDKLAEEAELDARLLEKRTEIEALNQRGIALSGILIEQNDKIKENTGVLKYQGEQLSLNQFKLNEMQKYRFEHEARTKDAEKIRAAREREVGVLDEKKRNLTSDCEKLTGDKKRLTTEKTGLEGSVSSLRAVRVVDDARMKQFMEETGYVVGDGRAKRTKRK